MTFQFWNRPFFLCFHAQFSHFWSKASYFRWNWISIISCMLHWTFLGVFAFTERFLFPSSIVKGLVDSKLLSMRQHTLKPQDKQNINSSLFGIEILERGDIRSPFVGFLPTNQYFLKATSKWILFLHIHEGVLYSFQLFSLSFSMCMCVLVSVCVF